MSIHNILVPNKSHVYCDTITANNINIPGLIITDLTVNELKTNIIAVNDNNDSTIILNNTIRPDDFLTIDIGTEDHIFGDIHATDINSTLVQTNNLASNTIDHQPITLVDTLIPSSSYVVNLGSNTDKFNDIYCTNLNSDNFNITDITLNTINATNSNTEFLGSYNASFITLNNNIIPAINTINIGNSLNPINNIYSNNLDVTNFTIDNLSTNIINTQEIHVLSPSVDISLFNTILPDITGTISLGSISKKFNNIYAEDIYSSGINTNTLSINTAPSITLLSDIDPNVNNIVSLGTSLKAYKNINSINTNTDNLGINTASNITLHSNIIPNVSDTINLGSSSIKFNNIYTEDIFSSEINTDSIGINTAASITLLNDIEPSINNTYNLGTTTQSFKEIHTVTTNTDNLGINTASNITLQSNIIPSTNNTLILGNTTHAYNNIYTTNVSYTNNSSSSIIFNNPILFQAASITNQSAFGYYSKLDYNGFTTGAFITEFSYTAERIGRLVCIYININNTTVSSSSPIYVQIPSSIPDHSSLYPNIDSVFTYVAATGITPPSMISLGKVTTTGRIEFYNGLTDGDSFSSGVVGLYPAGTYFTITYIIN